MAPSFYEMLFTASNYWNVFPKVTVKKKLTFQASRWLSRDVNVGEIKIALFQMNHSKTPGPDGFNVFFFQKKIGKL